MAIINGNNTIFATLNGNQFFIDRALDAEAAVYGYALTQAAYDLITPESDKYYAISNTASGEITAVLQLTQSQYDGMFAHSSDTLYIITADGTTISYAYMGDTGLEKLYQGSNVVWMPPAPIGYDEATFLDITGGATPKQIINKGQEWYAGSPRPQNLNDGNYLVFAHKRANNPNTCDLFMVFYPASTTDITLTYNSRWDSWTVTAGGYGDMALHRTQTFPNSVFAQGQQEYNTSIVINNSEFVTDYKNIFTNFSTLHIGTDVIPPYTAYNPI